MPMMLEIITAERQVFSDEVDMVVAPGIDGQLGILPRHAPLMTMLKPGELTVRKAGEEDMYVAVSGGFGSPGQPRQHFGRRLRALR